jgi:hypothetical protein
LYGCEIWSLSVGEKHRLRMFKYTVLKVDKVTEICLLSHLHGLSYFVMLENQAYA